MEFEWNLGEQREIRLKNRTKAKRLNEVKKRRLRKGTSIPYLVLVAVKRKGRTLRDKRFLVQKIYEQFRFVEVFMDACYAFENFPLDLGR